MKTVLITGCSQGIGLRFVRHYVKEGWKVIATARDPTGSKEVFNKFIPYMINMLIFLN